MFIWMNLTGFDTVLIFCGSFVLKKEEDYNSAGLFILWSEMLRAQNNVTKSYVTFFFSGSALQKHHKWWGNVLNFFLLAFLSILSGNRPSRVLPGAAHSSAVTPSALRAHVLQHKPQLSWQEHQSTCIINRALLSRSAKHGITPTTFTQRWAVGVYPCALACVKAIAHVGSHWINITFCINTVEALDWTQPWKPRGKKAERGRRSAPLLSLLQIRFPLKEQRRPNPPPCAAQTLAELRRRGDQGLLPFQRAPHADEGDFNPLCSLLQSWVHSFLAWPPLEVSADLRELPSPAKLQQR